MWNAAPVALFAVKHPNSRPTRYESLAIASNPLLGRCIAFYASPRWVCDRGHGGTFRHGLHIPILAASLVIYYADNLHGELVMCDKKKEQRRIIRVEEHRRTTHVPWGSGLQSLGGTRTTHSMEPDEGLFSDTEEMVTPSGCGCLAPAAGLCAACGRTVCTDCYRRCDNPGCHAPLGPCCYIIHMEGEEQHRCYCPDCKGTRSRGRLWRTVLCIVFSPFIQFKGKP